MVNLIKLEPFCSKLLNLINYSCSSYPTRASYSGQVDGFRNTMKNELKTWMQILLICILIKQQNMWR